MELGAGWVWIYGARCSYRRRVICAAISHPPGGGAEHNPDWWCSGLHRFVPSAWSGEPASVLYCGSNLRFGLPHDGVHPDNLPCEPTVPAAIDRARRGGDDQRNRDGGRAIDGTWRIGS